MTPVDVHPGTRRQNPVQHDPQDQSIPQLTWQAQAEDDLGHSHNGYLDTQYSRRK